jgi:hypothetical protein
MSESEPSCCSFSKTRSNLIFAGTSNGGILVWNLYDSETLTQKLTLASKIYIIHKPSYCTHGLYSSLESRVHQGVVKSISSIDEAATTVVSIDEFGKIQFWSVIDLDETDKSAFDLDFGMAIGSSIRLARGNTFSCNAPRMYTLKRNR